MQRGPVMSDVADIDICRRGWGYVASFKRGSVGGHMAGNAVGVFGADLQGVRSIGGEPGKGIAVYIADIRIIREISYLAVVADAKPT